MGNYQFDGPIRFFFYAIIALIIVNIAVNDIRMYKDKKTYKGEVDVQVERMYEYIVKPLSKSKTDRSGGFYSVELEYGILSEEQKSLLISEIKKDGFREPYLEKNCDGNNFCKGKIAIHIKNDNSKCTNIMVMKNRFDK